MNDETRSRGSNERRDSARPTRRAADAVEPEARKGDSAELVAFKAKLRPLMATVMGAKQAGHPDFHTHLQRLSDMIQND